MIIGISGKKQSGKNTVASMITKEAKNKYIMDSFAAPIKQILSILTGCKVKDLEKEEFKNKQLPKEWTCFRLMVFLDTQPVAQAFASSENEADELSKPFNGYQCKVESYVPTYREALQLIGTELFVNKFNKLTWVNAFKNRNLKKHNIIVPDVRFKHEAKTIKDMGGILIRVNRDNKTDDNHRSETELDDYTDFDYVIDNKGTKQDLLKTVKEIVNEQDL